VNLDAWWDIVERARAAVGERAGDRNLPDDPLPPALTSVLATLSPATLVDWEVTHHAVIDSAYRWPLWNAAFLIEGGCGDDGFIDFRDGLVLQGRTVFDQAVADPDSLADLPVTRLMATDEGGWLGYESISYLVADAYRQVNGNLKGFDQAVTAALRELPRPAEPIGPSWDPEDDDENRRHLPRLAELFDH
jgi:hypothetical protein